MSGLAWLDAGATASFGTVVEPCAFPQKFPQPAIVMRRYLAGETLIEAYWKTWRVPRRAVHRRAAGANRAALRMRWQLAKARWACAAGP